jgi:hypothetical protein
MSTIEKVKASIVALTEKAGHSFNIPHDNYSIEYDAVTQRFAIKGPTGMFIHKLKCGSGFTTFPDEQLGKVDEVVQAANQWFV